MIQRVYYQKMVNILVYRWHPVNPEWIDSNPSLNYSSPMSKSSNALVAQLDRVLGYEPSGRRFESSRVRQVNLFSWQILVLKFFYRLYVYINGYMS